jgi:hypothetical protein
MPVRIMETDPKRVADLARAWGVRAVRCQSVAVTAAAIATAYRHEVEAEERRAMHRRFIARLRQSA